MKILAVADTFVPEQYFEGSLSNIGSRCTVRIVKLDETRDFRVASASEHAIREYAGGPQQLVDELVDEEVLLVHAAPVTDRVLDASRRLRVVGVARGGPENVDLAAATARGIRVVAAPGRNADAVADLTLAFMVMLARDVLASVAFASQGNDLGHSAFEGARFFGHELGGHVLGLIGYGRVGAKVAQRALGYGLSVLVYDPFVPASEIERPGVTTATLRDLLSTADFVSLHARATAENARLIDKSNLDLMKPGAYFLNLARPSLVDETALVDALSSGRLAGAALDVVDPSSNGRAHALRSHPNVIVTPHIGGATYEAARRGVAILAEQIERYRQGQPMRFVVNAHELDGAG